MDVRNCPLNATMKIHEQSVQKRTEKHWLTLSKSKERLSDSPKVLKSKMTLILIESTDFSAIHEGLGQKE